MKEVSTLDGEVCLGGLVLEDGRVLPGVLGVHVVDGESVDGCSGDDVVLVTVLQDPVSSVPLDGRVRQRQLTLERHRVRHLGRRLVLQLANERETQLYTHGSVVSNIGSALVSEDEDTGNSNPQNGRH